MKRKGNLDDLRWVRLFTSDHIPRYLVEQIAHRDYEIDDFYHYLETNIRSPSSKEFKLNPLFHVWALVNKENLVKGFLWFTVDPLSKCLVIQAYSVDSNYWGKEAVKKLAKHMKEIRKKADLKKIYWITRFPKHSTKHGFKASKNILMEYNEEEEIKNGTNTTRKSGDDGSSETGTTELSSECDEG